MNNIEKTIQFLGEGVTACQIKHTEDITSNTPILFLDDQFTVHSNAIYICTAKHLRSRLKNLIFQDNCVLFIAESTKTGFCGLAALSGVSICETSLSSPKLFNMLSAALASLSAKGKEDDQENTENNAIKLQRFWENIRSEKLVNDIEIREALGLAGVSAGKYVRIIILSMDEDNADLNKILSLEEKLKNVMGSCVIIPGGTAVNPELIILRFYDEQNFAQDMQDEKLQTLLKEEKCRVAFGNSTRHYDMINSQYIFIKRTLDLAKLIGLNPEERAFHFDRYSVYYIIDLCAQSYVKKFKNTDILRLINPIIVHITRYDSAHGTNLRDVLFNYLASNRSLQATADAMHMHRNTVLNKLNTIKEISPIDFSDGSLCERLMLSCQIALYYERVLRHQITA